MGYTILSKTSSFMERRIVFETDDGSVETISAPAGSASFDDLEAQIADEYGATKAPKKEDPEPVEEPEQVPDETKDETPKAKKTSAKSKRASASAKAAE